MDSSTKQACFDEISHQICDSDAKVSINDISSNWKVNLRESERLLWAWYEQHKEQALNKEFLIRGIDVQGHCVISVIKESQLASVEKIFPKCTSSLFSLELPATNCNRLGTHQLSSSVVVNLPIEQTNRSGPSKVDNTHSTKSLATNGTNNKAVPKAEPTNPKSPKHKHAKPEPVAMKTEPQTPQKDSPKKTSPKTSASKTAVAKTPTVSGKSSIASFFSKPKADTSVTKTATTSKPPTQSATAAKPMEQIAISATTKPMEASTSGNETTKAKIHQAAKTVSEKHAAPKEKSPKHQTLLESRKRSLAALVSTDDDEDDQADEIPPTPKPVAKRKKPSRASTTATVSSKEAARALLASSDEDEIPGTPTATNTTKKANGSTSSKRRKATRTVTRTFEDEDGYIKTIKETEEYSCSEEENQPDNATKAQVAVKAPVKQNSPIKKSPANGGKTSAVSKAKQGSIMSFFKKK